MPVFEDWLREPLKIINNIHASDSSNFDLKVAEFFESKLQSQKNYNSIPCLNDVSIQELPPNCLVRYRCMIQDSSNPEYFILNHRLRNDLKNDTITLPSKYKDIVTYPDGYELCNDNLDDNNSSETLGQRLTFFCVPVPGESDWVKAAYKSNISSNVSSIASTSNYQNRPSKRPIDEQENEDSESQISNEQDDYSNIKRSKTHFASNISEIPDHAKLLNLNYPLQDEVNGISCLVKVYENFEQFKINDLVEFIGVLTIDPSLAFCNQCLNKQKQQQTETNENNKMETDNEIFDYMISSHRQTLNTCSCSYAPPSLVPRLHSIKSFHLKHENPLVENIRGESIEENNEKNFWTAQIKTLIHGLCINTNPQATQALLESSNFHILIKLRQEITNYFQEFLLLGDALAAEYLLMNIISGIFTRQDITILGKFTLNIFNVPGVDTSLNASKSDETFSNIFYKYFKELLTTSHIFKLSVDSLNKANFIPNKDYNNDKLMSGMLQLPNRFQLVIDETILNPGELKQKGMINMHALNDIIKWQKLNYDFEFHSQEFLTNIRVLILSNSKSILASDCQMKLKPSINLNQFKSEEYEANLQRAQKNESHLNFLNNLRKYLTIVSRLDYKLTENVQKFVEEDFVLMRQGNANEKICVEDFHLLLVVARLQCLTYARNELSINEWNKAKHLEKERRARLI